MDREEVGHIAGKVLKEEVMLELMPREKGTVTSWAGVQSKVTPHGWLRAPFLAQTRGQASELGPQE